MSAIAEPSWPPAAVTQPSRAGFSGAVRGELLKLAGFRPAWAMLGVGVLLFAALVLIGGGDERRPAWHHDHLAVARLVLDMLMACFQAGSGVVLLVLAAWLVGVEHSAGTIRVLLARGTGRLRLLLAKLTALGLVGLVLVAGYSAASLVGLATMAAAWGDRPTAIFSLPGIFWHEAAMDAAAASVSAAAAILVGVGASTLGRSLAFGLAAALAFYPADTAGVLVARLLNELTHWHGWLAAGTYLLGPNLNVLAARLQPERAVTIPWALPPVAVSGAHTGLVIGAWLVALAAVSAVISRRRDVQD
ncbi:MAG TPA: hypothetical protein VKF59_04235 [Candidatus Dormibacteraeota bacterium]|nr:hypothetical protein [Candidatus Dormibacteraeota bacterium]